jgi:hypothetical protein
MCSLHTNGLVLEQLLVECLPTCMLRSTDFTQHSTNVKPMLAIRGGPPEQHGFAFRCPKALLPLVDHVDPSIVGTI